MRFRTLLVAVLALCLGFSLLVARVQQLGAMMY